MRSEQQIVTVIVRAHADTNWTGAFENQIFHGHIVQYNVSSTCCQGLALVANNFVFQRWEKLIFHPFDPFINSYRMCTLILAKSVIIEIVKTIICGLIGIMYWTVSTS